MDTREASSWSVIARTWRAIVVVDVVESVRLMHSHEADVIDRWLRYVNEVRTEVLPGNRGSMVKSLGDGMLLEFENVPSAAAAALEIQRRISPHNAGMAADSELRLRVGAHAANVVVSEEDIFGAGVNLAARLAGLAAPGQIVVSAEFAEGLLPGFDGSLDDMGDCFLKHLAEPVHAFVLSPPATCSVAVAEQQSDQAISSSPSLAAKPPAIAVLPFNTALSDPSKDAVGDLVADCLSTRLSVSSSIRVISRLSSQTMRGRALTVEEFGSLLGADYIVSGRCSGSAGRLVIHVELADARDAKIVWVDRVATSVDELLEVDDDFSARVSDALLRAVTEAELQRVLTQPLPTLQGFTLLQGAAQLMHRSTQREFGYARDILDHLIDRHPRIASPHAWLANWHVLSVTKGLAPASANLARRAIDHTLRALDNDPACALALAMQGFVHCHMLRDLDAARSRLEDALRLNPSESLAWLFLSVVHGFFGDGDKAWYAACQALTLSPLDPQKHYYESLAASAALCARQHADAIQLAKSSLRMNRSHLPTLRALAIAQVEVGDVAAAQETARHLLQLTPDFTTSDYVAQGPKGAEETRRRYAQALEQAGVPAN